MTFSFILDSEKPQAEVTASREGDQVLLHLRATDNRALFDISVYDTVFTFAAKEGENTAFAGMKEAVMTFDITQFDCHSPLYAEVTDRAGNTKTVRIPAEGIEGRCFL